MSANDRYKGSQGRIYRSKINVGRAQEGFGINTLATVVEPVGVSGAVEESFVTNGNHMLGVKALHIGGHLCNPVCNGAGGASAGVGESSRAARLVRKLPREDGGRVWITRNDRLDIVFVGILDRRVGVETYK